MSYTKSTAYFVVLLLLSMSFPIYGRLKTSSSESRIKLADSAGKGALYMTTLIGDGSTTFFNGTLEVAEDSLNSRISTDDASVNYINLKQATVITGTSRAFVSARYRNIASGSGKNDYYQLLGDTTGMTFARFEPGQEVRELVIGDGLTNVGTVWLQGAPVFKTPIRFEAAFSNPVTIRWGLTGKLNQPIVLQNLDPLLSGTTQFILDTDLRLGDGVTFLPSKNNLPIDSPDVKITFSNSKLALGGTDLSWRSTLLLENANDIEMNANVKLGSAWLFSGNGMLQGNGNILDLSGRDADSTGTLGFATDYLGDNPAVTVTLFLRDIKLRLRNGALFTHERTILDLSNVEIELENTVNFTSGNIHISGPTMIYSKNYTFSVSNAATMTVDGTVLYYDTGQHHSSPGIWPHGVFEDFNQSSMGIALSLQNDGYVQRMSPNNVSLILTPNGGNVGMLAGNVSGGGSAVDPYTFTADSAMYFSSDVQLIVDSQGNDADGGITNHRFEGANRELHLAREANCIIVRPETRITFVDTIFKDFDPTAITLLDNGTTKAEAVFGPGCVLEFAHDVELGEAGDSFYTLTFRLDTSGPGQGNIKAGTPGNENTAKIDGRGHKLLMKYAGGQSNPGQIVVDDQGNGAGMRVELANVTIDYLGGWPTRFESEHLWTQICSLQHSNTVLYRNAQINLSNNYTYTFASMVVDGIVNIDTRQNTANTHPDDFTRTNNIFIFQPARQSTLTFSHNAQLVVGQNVTFSLDAIVTETTMAGMLVNGGTPFLGGTTGNVQYDAPWKSIIFPDSTAVMHFNGSTFHVTGTGLFFQKGSVNIEDNVTWVIRDDAGNNAQKKISLDTDTASGEAITLNILAGATIDIQGPVNHENIT